MLIYIVSIHLRSNLAETRGIPGWWVHLFRLSPRLPSGPPASGQTPESVAAAFEMDDNMTTWMGWNHFKVEKEVVFSGGAVGKRGEVGPESRIEDFLGENLARVSKSHNMPHLWHHPKEAGALVVREVAKLPLNIFPLHYILKPFII